MGRYKKIYTVKIFRRLVNQLLNGIGAPGRWGGGVVSAGVRDGDGHRDHRR